MSERSLSGFTDDRFELLELLGRGGMGEVYRALDRRLGRQVAIKLLHENQDDERYHLRLEREARVLSTLNHPNIATLHDTAHIVGRFGLVLELLEGESLANRLERGPMSWSEAGPFFAQVAAALDTSHQTGIVHRDLKPSNLFLLPDGSAKVLDFGLAKEHEPRLDHAGDNLSTLTDATKEGAVLGTGPYMSPEQARGEPVSEQTDIWSFGCCLFEALSGQRAFCADSLNETIAKVLLEEPDWEVLPAKVPPNVRSLLVRCLNKEQPRRQRSIGDVWIELSEGDHGAGELLPSKKPRLTASRALAAITGLALLLLILWCRDEQPRVRSPATAVGSPTQPAEVSPREPLSREDVEALIERRFEEFLAKEPGELGMSSSREPPQQ